MAFQVRLSFSLDFFPSFLGFLGEARIVEQGMARLTILSDEQKRKFMGKSLS